MQAGRPALIQKDGGEMFFAIVLDRPLADAKALVDDPAAFTQEMTRILLEKQSHPLIAQMIKPAGSSDPPPTAQPVALAAMNTTALVRQCSSSNRKWSTWGTHGCHLLRRYHCANTSAATIFSVQRLHGFRQVVTHVQPQQKR